MAPLRFQNQGALSSNYQGNARQLGFNELFLVINDIKRSNVVRITQIKNNQITLCMSMKGLENIQATTGTWMKNLEHNKANISTCMKNMEPN